MWQRVFSVGQMRIFGFIYILHAVANYESCLFKMKILINNFVKYHIFFYFWIFYSEINAILFNSYCRKFKNNLQLLFL